MLKITCDTCQENVVVNMHIANPRINYHRDGLHGRIAYEACAKGRAICPRCGADITKDFSSEITASDVIEMALRREIHV